MQSWDDGVALNTGKLIGLGRSAFYACQAANMRLTNSGQILSADGDGVEISNGNFARLLNTGEIEGGLDHFGVQLSAGAAGSRVVNRGEITGGAGSVDGSDFGDVLRNRGLLDGDATLRAGGDVHDGGGASFVDGKDRLRGGAGEDALDGGAQGDVLNRRRGDDVLTGGGKDRFVFGIKNGDDAITDFGGRDRVDLRAFDLGWKQLKTNLPLDHGGEAARDRSGHGGGSVLFGGVAATDLGKGDLLL